MLSGRNQVGLRLGESATIQDAIQKLVESHGPEFREALVDPVLGEPQPNALILLNGREIGVLEGVGTGVEDGDEIVLVPVIHGG
ncbi:MAG: MoaD/ThiS family protein [Candidatus Bathyarchaeota archaeon]|nr:MAG: MoaD/ThiS family protein [Candidatus Bathyarchaeota archaeon]